MRRVMVLPLGVAILTGGCAARQRQVLSPPPPAVTIGDRAPDFLFATAHGRRVEQADLRGKPFILFFFASWCEYCVKQAPDIEKLYQKCRTQDIPLFAIGINGYQDVLVAKMKRLGLTAPVALSPAMAESYGASRVPFTVFVDENGTVAWTVRGAGPYDQLEKGLEALRHGAVPAGAARGGR